MEVDPLLSHATEPAAAAVHGAPEPRTNPWLWFVLAAFAIAGSVRAVPFHILTPDSGEYLIAARSLVTGQGYRDLSATGTPPLTWRPPGLPFLLMPAAAPGLDSSSLAKGLMVLYGIALLWCLYQFAKRLVGPDWALLPVVFVAGSPQMLVYSTEILSEVPFTLALVGLLCLAHDWENERNSRWRALAIGLTLVALPMLRTVGMPILVVWLVWSLTAPHRRFLLVPTLSAIGVVTAWSAWLKFTGGVRYDSLIAKVIESEGLFRFMVAGIVNLLTYLPELNHELFPGFVADSLVGTVTDREFGPLLGRHTHEVLSLAGMIVLAGAATGILWKPGSSRWLTVLTLGTYLTSVCLYPLRSERLLWPVVPVLWTLFVSGALTAIARAQRQRMPRRPLTAVAAIVLLVLAATQLRDWPGMLRPAWRYWTNREQFYAANDDPPYYADWRSAAAFVRDHSQSDEAVISLIKEFYTISERRQVPLEIGRSPNELAKTIELNRVHWLAIGHGYSRRAMDRLLWHPRYSFVQRSSGVSEYQVYEVLPNRAGTIPLSIMQVRDEPEDRTDPSLWGQANSAFRRRDFDTCARNLRRLNELTSIVTAHLLLARAEARRGEFEEARLCYKRTRLLESNESFAREIVDGMREVELLERLGDPKTAADRRAALGVELATLHVDWGRFDEAWELIESLKQSHPDSGELWVMEARLLDWTGQAQQAEESFATAAKLGDRSAEELLLTRRWARALSMREKSELCAGSLQQTVDAEDVQSFVALAARWRKEDLPGRALAVLEQARPRFPEDARLQQELAAILDYYGVRSAARDTNGSLPREQTASVANADQRSKHQAD